MESASQAEEKGDGWKDHPDLSCQGLWFQEAVVELTGVNLMLSKPSECVWEMKFSSGAGPAPYQLTLDKLLQYWGLYIFISKIGIIIPITYVFGIRMKNTKQENCLRCFT